MGEESIQDSIREEDTFKQTMEAPQDTLKAAVKEISLDGVPRSNIRLPHIALTGQQSQPFTQRG